MRRSICRLRSSRALICLWLACVGAFSVTGLHAQPDAQIAVYLEVGESPPREEKILLVNAARLVGSGGFLDLQPLTEQLSSTVLSKRQVRFIDQAIPAGVYQRLEIDFGVPQETEDSQEAPRTFQPGRLRLELDLKIDPGECGFMSLTWDAHELVLNDGFLEPAFRIVEKDLPAVGARAYVANRGSGNLTVLDRATQRIVGVLMTGAEPSWIASSARLDRIYVACSGSDEIRELDLTGLTPLRRLSLAYGDRPSRLAISAESRRLVVVNPGSNTLAILDLESFQETLRIIVSEQPRGIAIDREGGRLYVASELSDEVQVYDLATGEAVPGFAGIHSPSELTLDPELGLLYAASRSERQAVGINLDTGLVVSRTRLRSTAGWLGYNPRLDRLFAALPESREIVVLKPEREIEVSSFPLETAPGFPAFDLDYSRLFVPLPATNRIIVINAKTGRAIGQAEVGANPVFVDVPR